MAQQPDNQAHHPWSDPWQQQQQQESQEQQQHADSNYSYYQYPQQAGVDQSYYQNYYQYPTAASSGTSATTSSAPQQYQYDYSNYDYSATAGGTHYEGYGDYYSHAQQQQQQHPQQPLAPGSSETLPSATSQYAYNSNNNNTFDSSNNNSNNASITNGYYYPPTTAVTNSNSGNNPWNTYQAPSSGFVQSRNTVQPQPQPTSKREPPSYIKVTPTSTSKPKPKPMMMMMDSSKKSGKPNNVQDNSSSTSQASISNPTSPGSIQSTTTSKPPSMESWPPSLKQYVEEVFNNCIPDRRDEAENELRRLILEKHREGTLMTLDWSNMDLPLYPYQNTSPNHGVTTFSSSRKRKDYHGIQGLDQEDEKRQSRQRRFQLQSESPRNRVAIGLQMMDINKHDSIIGTSQMLEKNYFRLTSAPDPSTVRPPKVLKKTLELLKTKWRDEQNYTYICDQFKSMRQDLTVQRIRDEFTVTVYEIHARIALEKGDLGEYNQCQSQLKQLYAMGINGNVMEFTAYRILYYLHTQNWSDINSIMFELTAEQKQNDLVKHALQVRSALSTSNYHRFFKLYVSAPQMGGYLMDQFVERERVRAMLILCKAYRPTMSLEFIQNELAFERQEDLLKFLKSHDASIFTQDKKALDTKLASRFFGESSKQFKKIDIKGQL
ncbi:hypothetical protein INT45_005866 [Circinella minor]|uniref:PCI domain-containing protein n=1 Tax=Circinella minor TaxID=1195481 RepID=A0A8H7S054_9FUNG|nr:hypothetical protein INT45_005866 [Circinella minor]